MIAKDIQALLREKIQLEKESQDTEYNMSVKSTEFHSLQSEYDTLSSTLKQLTNQKDVAQKRLDDLDAQVGSIHQDPYSSKPYPTLTQVLDQSTPPVPCHSTLVPWIEKLH